MDGFDKNVRRAEGKLGTALQDGKIEIGTYKARSQKLYNRVQRQVNMVNKEVTTLAGDIKDRLHEKIARVVTQQAKANSVLDQSTAGLTTMNTERETMNGTLSAEYEQAAQRLTARVTAAKDMTNRVVNSLYNDALQTFTLAGKTVEAEGDDARQGILDDTEEAKGSAEQRIGGLEDEINKVKKNIEKEVEIGQKGIKKVNHWVEGTPDGRLGKKERLANLVGRAVTEAPGAQRMVTEL